MMFFSQDIFVIYYIYVIFAPQIEYYRLLIFKNARYPVSTLAINFTSRENVTFSGLIHNGSLIQFDNYLIGYNPHNTTGLAIEAKDNKCKT